MPPQNPAITQYRVEISGWDSREEFFVEKTTLEWSEEEGKKVHLRHPVRAGAVVFVRLIDPTASRSAYTVAYQARSVTQPDNVGMRVVSLAQLGPRCAATDSPEKASNRLGAERQ